MRILVVEDQKKIASFLKRGLNEAHYAVDTAYNGADGEMLGSEHDYDLVILDVMLPDQSGLSVAKKMRSSGYKGPMLMLSALSTTKDKVGGLDAGADDYLTKPFSFDELLARVRALLRRKTATGEDNTILSCADLSMNLLTREVRRDNNLITLTPKEFSLLEYFLRNPGRVITRTEISEHIWDAHFDSGSNVIDVYVNMLRKKLENENQSRLIHTLVGAGYILKNDSKV